MPDSRTVVIGVTGASGALYATRTIASLLGMGCRVEAVFSEFGRRLLRDELGYTESPERILPYLAARHDDPVERGELVVHANRDVGASIASGAYPVDGMAIVPCSMKTLAGVAHGASRTLIERAADVMLKERRRLVLVPRETPMSLPQLRNMVLCAEAGGVVLPAAPAFYQQPRTLDDLADFIAGKVLTALGFAHRLYPTWTGRVPAAPGEVP